MYLLFAQLISSCLAVPDQNVSIDRESCKAGGSSFVPAAVGASYGDVETRITHHQCKSIKGYPYSNKFFSSIPVDKPKLDGVLRALQAGH